MPKLIPSIPEETAALRPALEAAPESLDHHNGMKGVKTGSDWKKMTRADKEIYVLSVMGNLSRRDIFLEKPYSFYIDDLDRRFQSDPGLETTYVHHLLLKSAHENEPESRKEIETVWK